MKIYTKKGDTGLTSTSTERNVSKNSTVIHTLGDLDELCAYLGSIKFLDPINILRIQQNIMDICSFISLGGEESKYTFPDDLKQEILHLETLIDAMVEKLPELKNFIILGSNQQDSNIHITRAVCRRVERVFWSMDKPHQSSGIYLNRLSDYLFTLARFDLLMNGYEPKIYKCGLIKA